MEGINWKAAKVELSPNCPRCGSSNTKFCYYNNYSLTQPRYFCKGCRRYWTKGGSLRNVPVGGGCRKNHRRGKSFRHDRLASKDLAAGHHHQYPSGSSALLAESSSTTGNSASNIDLALVYANFLHQKAEPKSTCSLSEMPELPSELHPSFQLSTNGKQPDSSSYDQIQLPPKTHLSEGNNHGHVHLGGSFHHHQHDDAANVHGLPPLPDQEMLWPISQFILQNHTFHQTQLWPVPLQAEASQDPNIAAPSAGKWSPFDLPSYM